ncbi:hypothetical protein MMC08_004321 [Hypocenomyce scalaris]|nr:hypothetical protein [Hypocenomyce scalaris]
MTITSPSTYQLPSLPSNLSTSLTIGTSIPPPPPSPPPLTPLKTAVNPLKQHPYSPSLASPLSTTSTMPGAFPTTPSPGPTTAYNTNRDKVDYFAPPTPPTNLKRKPPAPTPGSPTSTATPTPAKRPTTVRRFLSLMALKNANGHAGHDPSSPPSPHQKQSRSFSNDSRPSSPGGASLASSRPTTSSKKSSSGGGGGRGGDGGFWTRRKSSLSVTLNSLANRSSDMLARRGSNDLMREKRSTDALRGNYGVDGEGGGKRDWVEDGLGEEQEMEEMVVVPPRPRSPPPKLPELERLGSGFGEGDIFGDIQ